MPAHAPTAEALQQAGNAPFRPEGSRALRTSTRATRLAASTEKDCAPRETMAWAHAPRVSVHASHLAICWEARCRSLYRNVPLVCTCTQRHGSYAQKKQ